MITSIIKSNVSTAFQLNGEDLWIPLPNHCFASNGAITDFLVSANESSDEALTNMFHVVFRCELDSDSDYGHDFEDITDKFIQKH